jgi:hypothetical protein
MEQLVWYSIPGALFMFTLSLFYPELKEDSLVAVAIGGTPIIGFIIHQAWRTLFELFGGFHHKRRMIILEIMKQYGISTDSRLAFLIWEITFYSDKLPSSFRDHDRGVWHYVMSFWSVVLASALSIGAIYSLSAVTGTSIQNTISWSLFFLAIGATFLIKGILSACSIGRQEVGVFKKYREHFDETARQIGALK